MLKDLPIIEIQNIPYTESICPYCYLEGKPCQDVKTEGAFTTLVGFSGGPENNPNHQETLVTCNSCGKQSDKHFVVKHRNAWYFDDQRILLLGRPTCCGASIKCPCGGMIVSENNVVSYTSTKEGMKPLQKMYMICHTCGSWYKHLKHGDQFYTDEQIAKVREEHQEWLDSDASKPRFLDTKWSVAPAEDTRTFISAGLQQELEEAITKQMVDEMMTKISSGADEIKLIDPSAYQTFSITNDPEDS